ncbi:MAG: hypothetical protein AB7G48_15930 [Nitrospiraceae bacterium]
MGPDSSEYAPVLRGLPPGICQRLLRLVRIGHVGQALRERLAKVRKLLYTSAWITRAYTCIYAIKSTEGPMMEKRAPSHTEEEEMNQRRRLLGLARRGDQKAINKLFELYQVRVFSGDNLKKAGKLPVWPGVAEEEKKAQRRRDAAAKAQAKAQAKAAAKASEKKAPRPAKAGTSSKAAHGKSSRPAGAHAKK